MIVLLPNCGYLSETSRMLHIAQALQARGEAVAIATHGGPYTRVLDNAGMPYTVLQPVMDACPPCAVPERFGADRQARGAAAATG